MEPAQVKSTLIRQFVKNNPGTRFYPIWSMLIAAGFYTGTDLDERDLVNADINTVIEEGHIRWSNEAAGFIVCEAP